MSTPAILLIHFKDSPCTLGCLDSLAKVSAPFSVFVIAVQSHQLDPIQNHPLHPQFVSTDKNLGFAYANNLLIKQAFSKGHQQVVLLNNDTTVDPNFLPPLQNQLKKPDVGMVCPKIYFTPGREYHYDSYQESDRGKVVWYMGGINDWANVAASHFGVDEVDHGQFESVIETDFATGCCLAITKSVIDKIGLMDERYFLYYEDNDWSQRTKKAGFKIIVEPKSVIYHQNAGSTGGSGSKLHQHYQSRSRLIFGLKYAPLKTKLHLIKNALIDLKSSNPTLRKAAYSGLTGRMGKRS